MEIKNSRIGVGAKVPHLSYIGDADVGEGTNIGAGAITANYRPELGPGKFRTEIGRNVHTGVHNVFVAPVTIGDNAWVAAGSVVTKNVPPGALAIARSRQVNKEGYDDRKTLSSPRRCPASSPREPRAEPVPGHFIERGPLKRLMVFAGRSHPELAQRMAEQLGVELGDVELKSFANDETYVRYTESIRGADVFIVQTGSEPVDRNLMELLLMIQAAKLASAKRITAVIPWFPYSRQDRKAKPREPISGRLVADMLQLAGADRVLTMDLHAGQIQGFFTIPVDHMTALPLFAKHFRDLGLTGDGVVSVAPDAGRAKHALKFSEMISADFAIMHKTRPAHEQVGIVEVTGRVRDKIAVVGDDVTTTGGTQIAGAKVLLEHGAKEVWMFVTHSLLDADTLGRVAAAGITGLVITDTVPVDPTRKPDNVTVLTVSRLLAETIMNVFSDDSVSAIFGGENQLF